MRTLSMEEVSLVSGAGEGCNDDSGSSDNYNEQRSSTNPTWSAFWTGTLGTLGSRFGPTGGGLGAAAGQEIADLTWPGNYLQDPPEPPTGGNCPSCHDGGPGNP